MMITRNQCIVPCVAEHKVCVRLNLARSLIPWCFTVAAHDRKQIADAGSAPTGRRVQRHIKANFLCHCCQCADMRLALRSLQTADVAVLILDLNTDHRTAVLFHASIDLRINLFPEPSDIVKIFLVVTADRHALFLSLDDPVWESAVPHFPVHKRSDTQEYRQSDFPAQSYKRSDIPASFKIKHIFLFLVVNPDHIGRDDRNSARLYFAQ